MIIAISNETIVMNQIADIVGRNKKVVFIDTASNGQAWDKTWLEDKIWAIKKEYPDFHRYSIEWKDISDFKKGLQAYDIIHIWWGRTAYLLHHILQTWFDTYLREMENSKIIIGSSAGAKILGENIGHVEPFDNFTDVEIKDGSAVWLLNFDIWAHFWNEKYREKYNMVFDIAYKNSQSWIYISDNSFIVSTAQGTKIYRV